MKYFKNTIFFLTGALVSALFFYGYQMWGDQECTIPSGINLKKVLNEENVVPALVIGSGPAGNAAALYLARSGIGKVLVITGSKPGGLLTETTWVENWPGIERALGPDIMQRSKEQAERFGVEFVYGSVESVNFSQWPFAATLEDGKTIKALSVVIATGASPRKLGVPGEDTYWAHGVTSCAKCDAPFFKGKNVIVVGGGDSAIEEASILSPYAKEVTILVRKARMRAAAIGQTHLGELSNVKVLYNHKVQKITGDGKEVTGVELLNSQTGETSSIPIDGVFLAIGHIPNSVPFRDVIKLVKGGYIKVLGRGQQTSICGVFAAGDVEDAEYKQAGTAAGDGIKAGLDAVSFLHSLGMTKEIAEQLTRNFGMSFDQKGL